jgi:hypothetical protein
MYLVRLVNAVGTRRDFRVSAARGSTACSRATRRMEQETGERWYAIDAEPVRRLAKENVQ